MVRIGRPWVPASSTVGRSFVQMLHRIFMQNFNALAVRRTEAIENYMDKTLCFSSCTSHVICFPHHVVVCCGFHGVVVLSETKHQCQWTKDLRGNGFFLRASGSPLFRKCPELLRIKMSLGWVLFILKANLGEVSFLIVCWIVCLLLINCYSGVHGRFNELSTVVYWQLC